MGRYFQPSGTQFIDNFIYQPPWQLMQNVLANKQQEYDSAVAATKLFRDIKINHLNGEDENYNVAEKQRYYNDKADAIAKAMQKDKLNAGSYNPNIEMLQKELVKDFTEGDISKIQGSYGAYQKWMEDNKKMKEESPYRYDAAEKHYLGQWANAGANSLNQRWKGDMVTKDVDWNKIYDAAEKMKSDEWERAGTNHAGGYIYKNKNSGEKLKERDLMNNILGRVLTPDNKASLLQTQKYGLATYFNPETGGIDLDASGWIPARLFSNAAAYTKSKQDADVQSDGTWNNIYSQNQQNARQQAGFAHDREMKNLDYQIDMAKEKAKQAAEQAGDINKSIREYEKIAADGKQDPGLRQFAAAEARRLSGVGFVENAAIPNTYKNVASLLSSGDKLDPVKLSRIETVLKENMQGKTEAEKIMMSTVLDKLRNGQIRTKDQMIEVMTQKAWQMYNSDGLQGKFPKEIQAIIGKNRNNKRLDGVTEFTPGELSSDPLKTYKADIRKGVKDLFDNINDNSEKIIENNYGSRVTKFESADLPYSYRQANLQYFNNPETKNTFIYRDMVTGEEIKDIDKLSFNDYKIGSSNGLAATGHILTNSNGRKVLAISTDDDSNLNNALKYNAVRGLPQNSTIRNTITNSYKQRLDKTLESASPKEGNLKITDPTGLTKLDIVKVYAPNNPNKAVFVVPDSYGNIDTGQQFNNTDELTNYLLLKSQQNKK